jgi:hypothetical protein
VAPSKSIVVPVRYSGDLSSHLTSPLSSSGLPSLLRGEASATLSLQKSSGLTPSLEARASMSLSAPGVLKLPSSRTIALIFSGYLLENSLARAGSEA